MSQEVTLMGHTFKYFVEFDCSEHTETYRTSFYKETTKHRRKKWFLFGPIIEIEEPVVLFKIYDNAHSRFIPKSWWRKEIEKQIEILYREEEIKNGELI
jgi:hypothetical protein